MLSVFASVIIPAEAEVPQRAQAAVGLKLTYLGGGPAASAHGYEPAALKKREVACRFGSSIIKTEHFPPKGEAAFRSLLCFWAGRSARQTPPRSRETVELLIQPPVGVRSLGRVCKSPGVILRTTTTEL